MRRSLAAPVDEHSALHNQLSRGMHATMKAFWDESAGFIMPVADALKLDQRFFTPLARRGYVEFLPSKKGFRCTHIGWRVRDEWDNTDPWKKHLSQQFGSFIRSAFALSGKYTETKDGIVKVMTIIKGRKTRPANLHIMRKVS